MAQRVAFTHPEVAKRVAARIMQRDKSVLNFRVTKPRILRDRNLGSYHAVFVVLQYGTHSWEYLTE